MPATLPEPTPPAVAVEVDARTSLGYRVRYWNRRLGTLALRTAERLITGMIAPHGTRALAIRPPMDGAGTVETQRRRHPATVLHYPAPDGLPDWLVREAGVDATWSYALRDAVLAPEPGVVWLANGTPVPELCGGISRYAGSQDVRGLARVRARERLDGTWGVLANHTYYHFLTEDLPALLASLAFAREVLGVDPGVITPQSRHRYVADALGTLGARVHATSATKVSVERLVASGFASSLIHPSSIDLLRTHFALTEAPGERWLYVSRAGFRRAPTWERELVEALEQHLPQVEVIHGHRLSLIDQVAAFSEAAVVIGPHGAGLSNLVFSPHTTRVVELATPQNRNDHFWRVAALRGQSYRLIWADGDQTAASVAQRVVDAVS